MSENERGTQVKKHLLSLAHFVDAVLRIVAVNNENFQTLAVIQVARYRDRKGSFACSSLLGGESDEFGFFHSFLNRG